MTMKFEAGKTYAGRSVCDHDCIVLVEVISRTAKTISARTSKGVQTLRIKEWDGVEQVKPWGSYSMAPIVGADHVFGITAVIGSMAKGA